MRSLKKEGVDSLEVRNANNKHTIERIIVTKVLVLLKEVIILLYTLKIRLYHSPEQTEQLLAARR